MENNDAGPANVDEYIARFSPEVQVILQRTRKIVRDAAPHALDVIGYGIPAARLNRILVYFAAFKKHIGLFAPNRGDTDLETAASRYAGLKGNLRFPLNEPIPHELIGRWARFRVAQESACTRADRRSTQP